MTRVSAGSGGAMPQAYLIFRALGEFQLPISDMRLRGVSHKPGVADQQTPPRVPNAVRWLSAQESKVTREIKNAKDPKNAGALVF